MPGARVLLYTTRYCGYCSRARRLLEARAIPFDEIDLTDDPTTRRRIIDETGHRTVPVILIDGQLIGGSDELAELDETGELSHLTQPAP
jgi:glutaredoxin 3